MFGVKKTLKRLLNFSHYQSNFDDLKILAAQMLVRDNRRRTFRSLNESEFKVFSQCGEDGIVQYLVNKLPIVNKVFVEFGVENYKEANTKFLLMNDNWSGLVLDGSLDHVNSIKESGLFWQYDLAAKNVFVKKSNINAIIEEYMTSYRFEREIGLLSIDIDGNDYHIWEAITSIDPMVVICEYNWIFGNKHLLTVPYDESFQRTKKHYSNLYFGASICALTALATEKGYEYVGCTEVGNDAFFVKKEYAQKYLPELITTPQETFKAQKSSESRDKNGTRSYIRGKNRLKVIENMDVLDLESGQIEKLNKYT
jgi:hypothetical protein